MYMPRKRGIKTNYNFGIFEESVGFLLQEESTKIGVYRVLFFKRWNILKIKTILKCTRTIYCFRCGPQTGH